jgi:hypothetical protein
MPGFKYSTAQASDDLKNDIPIGNASGEITAYKASTSENGNAMLSIKVKLDSEDGVEREVWGRITFADTTFKMVKGFLDALDKDGASEFGDNEINEALLNDWGKSLVGELVSFKIRMSQAQGEYASRPEINPFSFKRYDTTTTADSLLADL